MTHQTNWAIEIHQLASDMVNKDTCDTNAETEYSALTAETTVKVTEHAGNSQTALPAHLTATPHPLIGNTPNQEAHASTQPQTIGTANNILWFQNYQDANHPRTSTAIQTPTVNNILPGSAASITEAIT